MEKYYQNRNIAVLTTCKDLGEKTTFPEQPEQQYCAKLLLSGILNILMFTLQLNPQSHRHRHTERKMFSSNPWCTQRPRLKAYRYQYIEGL